MMFLEDKEGPLDYKDHRDEDVLSVAITNPAVFGVLIERYEEAFLRKVRGIVGYTDDAYDIVQETFTKIYLNADKYKPMPGASFKSWAYRILLNVTFTWYGKLKKNREAVLRLDPELDEVIPDKKASAEFEKETTKDYVISVLVRMPDSFARVLRSYFIEGKSQKEIAAEEGVSVEAIKTRMCRAKKEFKKVECEL
jgi:RNA polymerase sigma-70 factor (ECF subfamily)